MSTKEEILIEGKAFVFKGERYAYDDVIHLRYEATHTTLRMDFSKAGEYDDAALSVYLKQRERPLTLTAGLVWFPALRNTKAMRARLAEVYQQLANKTLVNRTIPYATQLDKKGYFTYDGVDFYADGMVRRGRKSISIYNARIQRADRDEFKVHINPCSNDIIAALRAGWNIAYISVDTRVDGDVFEKLVEELYGKHLYSLRQITALVDAAEKMR